ncbi:MAG: hypothetical protein ACR2PH_10330 [Desulfobulbia bacterium]
MGDWIKLIDTGNSWANIVIGIILFYVGIKLFSGGFKSMGDTAWLQWFVQNPAMMFVGAIGCTLAWQSSSLTTAAIVGLVASGILPLPGAIAAVLGANIGTTGTIWIAGILATDGRLTGDALRIAIAHTGFNLTMGLTMLPFVRPIAAFIQRIT